MASTSIIGRAEGAYLAAARSATLATIAPDGRPRLVPVCFIRGTDDERGRARLYSPIDEKPKLGDDPNDLARIRDIQARPAATLLVDRWSEDWSRLGWLRLDTSAELIHPGPPDLEEHGAAVAALRAKYPQYAGHRLEGRPILRFTVERSVAWGDLGTDGAG